MKEKKQTEFKLHTHWNGTAWVLLPKGNNGQALVLNSNIPSWQNTTSFLMPPTIINTSVTNIQSFSATLNSTINPNNLSTDVFFEWGTNTGYGNTTPSIPQKVTGSTISSVGAHLSLTPARTYHYRVKAVNAVNTVYSSDQTFTSQQSAPVLATFLISDVMALTATHIYNIINDGGSAITARGTCWSTLPSPTIANNKTTDGTGISPTTSYLTGLIPGTTYYVRAYATNAIGTSYSNQTSFTTQNGIIALTTTSASSIMAFTATSGGNITADGGSAVIARGVCWGTTTGPTIAGNKTSDGAGVGQFSSSITDLTPGTTYYIRAYATNEVGTSYGSEITFTTRNGIIALTTTSASSIMDLTATSGGSFKSDGGSAIIERGVCWGTTSGPTISGSKTIATDGAGFGVFSSSLTGLTAGTTYFIRAYATNAVGTSYGNELSFKTSEGTVTDIEGNVYSYLTIGSQVWMRENLKTTKYRNGDLIGTTIPLNKDIHYEVDPKYQWSFNGIESNAALYGRLYTWYSANDNRCVCPAGWHMPSDTEWAVLENYLIANSFNYDGTLIGNKIGKALALISNWNYSSIEGAVGNTDYPNYQNKTGFSAQSSGFRGSNGNFDGIGNIVYWWSTSNDAWYRVLMNNHADLNRGTYFKSYAYSVRCLRD